MASPKTNTIVTEDAFIVQLALPGWRKNEVNVEIDGDLLKIIGKSNTEKQTDTVYKRREFWKQEFEKTYHLPETVDLDAIKAGMDQGILEVVLPLLPESKPIKKQIALA